MAARSLGCIPAGEGPKRPITIHVDDSTLPDKMVELITPDEQETEPQASLADLATGEVEPSTALTNEACKSARDSSASARTKAQQSEHLWSYNFVVDWLEWGQKLKTPVVIDEYRREFHKIKVALASGSSDVISILDRLIGLH